MNVTVIKFKNVKEGLEQRVGDSDSAFEFEQNTFAFNMNARIESNELWKTWLDSRTMLLYGGKSQKYDGRHVFKIDNEFPLSIIMNSIIQPNGAISINDITYNSSTGTEFIVIEKKDIKGAKEDFAIRSDKYEAVKEQLNGSIDVDAFVKAGGFKVNKSISSEEVISYNKSIEIENLTQTDVNYVNDGWLELAVGKNRGSAEDYQTATLRLAKYTAKAESMSCFNDNNKGMGLFISTQNANLELRHLCVGDSDSSSYANDRYFFGLGGRFLRVRRIDVAEGDAAQTSSVEVDYVTIAENFNNHSFAPGMLASSLNETGIRNAKSLANYLTTKQ